MTLNRLSEVQLVSSTALARLLHISDLHLVETIETHGRRVGWGQRTWGTASHDCRKIDALWWTLEELKRAGRGHNFVLVTGDLTTDGSEGALRTAREFIEEELIRRGQPLRPVTKGLGIGADRRVLLPGNHDRFGGKFFPRQRRNNLFEQILGTANEYPYAVAIPLAGSSKTVLFFVYDTTPPLTVRFDPFAAIARGHVTRAECSQLLDLAGTIAGRRWADGLDGTKVAIDPADCIRIALMHHHPVIDKNKAKQYRSRLEYMENHEVFVEYCFKAGIQLVLFGHQHLAYEKREQPPKALASGTTPFGPVQNLYFLCCPSLLEYTSKNGFYLLEIYDREILVQPFHWMHTEFVGSPIRWKVPLS